jgi:hypothetical protein
MATNRPFVRAILLGLSCSISLPTPELMSDGSHSNLVPKVKHRKGKNKNGGLYALLCRVIFVQRFHSHEYLLQQSLEKGANLAAHAYRLALVETVDLLAYIR